MIECLKQVGVNGKVRQTGKKINLQQRKAVGDFIRPKPHYLDYCGFVMDLLWALWVTCPAVHLLCISPSRQPLL